MNYIWNRSGSLGDCIVTLNLLKNFKKKYNSKVIYKCHPWTKSILEKFFLSFGIDEVTDQVVEGTEIQLFGYPVNLTDPLKGHPYVKMHKHLIEYFADNLDVEPDFDSLEMEKPKFPFKEDFITVHVQGLWSPYKNWPLERWERLCLRLKEKGIKVLQIGGLKDPEIRTCHGRIGATEGNNQDQKNFEMSLAALGNAKLHVGLDTWTNHASNIHFNGKRTKAIILWGSSNVIATGYKTNVNIVKGLACQPCMKESPEISKVPLGICENPSNQTYDNPKHQCMQDITIDEVYKKVMESL